MKNGVVRWSTPFLLDGIAAQSSTDAKSLRTMVLFLLSAVASLNPAAAMRTDVALRRPAVSPAGAAMSRAGLIVAKDKPKKEKAAKEEAPKEEKAAPAPAPAPPLQAPAPDGFEWGQTY